jgi:hypothetical protein
MPLIPVELDGEVEEVFALPDRYRRHVRGTEEGRPIDSLFIVRDGEVTTYRDGKKAATSRATGPGKTMGCYLNEYLLASDRPECRYTLIGETQLDSRRATGIRVQFQGSSVELYFDRTTNLLVQSRREVLLGPGGSPLEVILRFEDFRPVGGVQFPMRLVFRSGDHQEAVITVSEVEFFPSPPAGVFEGP